MKTSGMIVLEGGCDLISGNVSLNRVYKNMLLLFLKPAPLAYHKI